MGNASFDNLLYIWTKLFWRFGPIQSADFSNIWRSIIISYLFFLIIPYSRINLLQYNLEIYYIFAPNSSDEWVDFTKVWRSIIFSLLTIRFKPMSIRRLYLLLWNLHWLTKVKIFCFFIRQGNILLKIKEISALSCNTYLLIIHIWFIAFERL